MSEDKILDQELNTEERAKEISRYLDEADEIPAGFLRRSKEPKWYVVHTYSGHENKVKVNLEKLVENRGMQDLVLQVIVPTETVYDRDSGKSKERKIFPGYVIVKMIVTNESWYLVRNTQGVTGFVGQGWVPIPLKAPLSRCRSLRKSAAWASRRPSSSWTSIRAMPSRSSRVRSRALPRRWRK